MAIDPMVEYFFMIAIKKLVVAQIGQCWKQKSLVFGCL
jgi:hypothetical protein